MQGNKIELGDFESFVLRYSKEEICSKRRELLLLLDGDVFYHVNGWPTEMERILWKKPLSDEETFKLMLFLLGNGCGPQLTCEWILTSTYWDRQKTRKRCDQMKWIFTNMDRYAARWFYFDMFHKIHLYVNGEERKLKA